MKENLLLTPGPTKLPDSVREALARPIIHHRTPQFQQYLKDAVEGLKYVFQTKNDIYLFAASGTGAMESAVCNLQSPGDKAVVLESGKFGERWTELCKAYQINPTVVQVKWGRGPEPDQVKKALAADKAIKVVYMTHCETSTGVTNDVKAIAEVVKQTDAILVVDAISSLGVTDLQTDNWGVDVVVSASHKGFMLPPGLAFVSVSKKAWKFVEASKTPRYYFDWRASKKAWESVDTPYTPAIGLVIALLESLKIMKTTGLEKHFAHIARLAQGTREAAKALGLTLFPEDKYASNVLTAINVPQGIDGEKLVKTMRDVQGITIAGGQAELKGKIIRIAHMGCLEESDMLTVIAHLEKVLNEMGYACRQGTGEKAAQKVFNG